MEKEINENIIEIEGKKYKFIEAEKSICCRSCDLRKDRRCHLLHRMCISDNRKDKKEGYFKIVEDHQDNPQEFRVGDEVIDIITGQRGKISQINTNDGILPMYVSLNEGEYFYTLDGRYSIRDKHPRLLHYRNDYDYSIIDFNNLPKRQEPKRWRAKEGETYYRFTSNFEVKGFYDDNDISDNVAYDSGNYFKTKEEAQEVDDKLNKYFQELINPNK